MKEALKAYIDLTRAHFFIVWPLLFCSGLVLAFENYGGFSWSLLLKAALIALAGFEAGFVLNDYVDRNLDKKGLQAQDSFNKYWRFFGRRPLAEGLIAPKKALWLFFGFAGIAALLIFTLPAPNSYYVFCIMLYSYGIEAFYQIKKRNQNFPLAQLAGRTDLSLFPGAGYLCYGQPDSSILLYVLFFYPWTQAHLAINDLIDIQNDKARGMKTIPLLYGIKGCVYWIAGFTLLHFLAAGFFLKELGSLAFYGFSLAFLLLTGANLYLLKAKSSEAGLKVLPIFHATLLIYTLSILLDFFY